jgi:hypothetical protein
VAGEADFTKIDALLNSGFGNYPISCAVIGHFMQNMLVCDLQIGFCF